MHKSRNYKKEKNHFKNTKFPNGKKRTIFFISIFLKEKWILPSFNSLWLATFLFALMFIVIGILIVYGFSRVEAQTGSLILLFDIVIGIFLGYIFFQEKLTIQTLIGGGIILIGIILPNLNFNKF